MLEKCPRCSSSKIIPDVALMDHYGDLGFSSDQAQVKVAARPNALLRKDTSLGRLSIHICGECGYAELQVSDARALYEKHENPRET